MVKPGDQLRMEIEAVRLRSRIAVVKGLAYVGDELASEAELTLGMGLSNDGEYSSNRNCGGRRRNCG